MWSLNRRRFCYTYVGVGSAIVEKFAASKKRVAFYKNNVGNLSNLFPFFFGREHRLVSAPDQSSRIVAVEDGNAGAVCELVIGAVVDEINPVWGYDGRRSRFRDPRIKLTFPHRQHRRSCGLGPVDKVGGIGQPCLVFVVGGRAEEIHPVFPVDLFRYDRARLGPTDVPVSSVCGKDDALALPVNQISRCCETELCVFLVIRGVGEVIDIAELGIAELGIFELNQARVFDAAVFFVRLCGRKDGLGSPREVQAVAALGVAESRSAVLVLSAVEHDDLACAHDDCGIERAGRFPAVAFWRGERRDDGSLAHAMPGFRRLTCAMLKIQRQEQRQETGPAGVMIGTDHLRTNLVRWPDLLTMLTEARCEDRRRIGRSPAPYQVQMSALRFSRTLIVLATILGTFFIVHSFVQAAPLAAQTKSAGSAAASAYEAGRAAWERGDMAAAHEAFEKAVRLNPRSADAQNMLGQVLLRQGQVDDAIAHFRAVVKLRPTLAVAHAYLGQALQAQVFQTQALQTPESLDEAVTEFRLAVQLAPKTPQAHEALGRALSLQQKTDEAAAEIEEAVRLAPGRAEYHDELGALWAQQRKFADAEKEFREALRLDPKYEPAYLHLGAALASEGETKQAQDSLDQAIKLDPNDAIAWYQRGLLEQAANPDEALRSFERAAVLKPNLAALQTSFGLLLQRRGDVERAVTAFSKVVELSPSDPEAHNNLALALVQQGGADAAIKEFQRALQLRPGDAGFLQNLGTAYLQKTDFDAAAGQFRAALILDPERASLHYDLALALKLKDDLPAAIAEWKEAIRLDPKLVDAHYSLGITLWQSGDFPAAVEQMRQAIQIQPDYAEAYYMLGTILKQMGKLPEAADALREATRLQPDFGGAHTTLASILRQLGDSAGAAAESKLGAEITKEKNNLQAATFATNSGRRLLNTGDLDGAISQFRSAIDAMPTYAAAHYQLGLALRQKGDADGAKQELQKAAELGAHATAPSN